MKINLGCGGVYKQGYLNVDMYNTTIADKVMSATSLDFKDNSVEKIEAKQLIEHLGMIRSIYALSECYRVLNVDGTLVIETPDIKKSFQIYLNGDREDRKKILPWIYGVDVPGQVHKFCYPDDLLEETLQKIGFINIEKEYLKFDNHQPIIRFICKKQLQNQSFQIIACFRKELIKKKIIDLEDQIRSLEKEHLIEYFSSKISYLIKNNKILDEITMEGGVFSPEITYIFLKTLLDNKLISKKRIQKYLEVLKILIKLDFPSILFLNFREIPDFTGEQKRLFQIVKNLGRKTIKNLLDAAKKSSTIESLININKKIRNYDKIDFFSEKILQVKGNHFFILGVKKFSLKEYNEAIDLFKISISYHRNQILSYLNLARLFVLTKDLEQSRQVYNKTICLVTQLKDNNKDIIKKMIEEELSKSSTMRILNPVILLTNLNYI